MDPPNLPFTTEVRPYGKAAIEHAAQLILAGLPVAVPTETVYGLAADATNRQAVAAIFAAKGRPQFNPLIVHVSGLAQAEEFGLFDDTARALASAYWPGALTLVVPRREGSSIEDAATSGLPTIALRCPAHPAMRALLAACGRPLGAPSANASGGISPTNADHVVKSLEGRIPLVIDGGPTSHGIESTIVGVTGGSVRLLRPGPVPFEEVAALAGLTEGSAGDGAIEAPGQMQSHYAPNKPLRLNAVAKERGEWLIGFGSVGGDDSLSRTGSLTEAATRLFHALHRAEASSKAAIAVAPIPERGIGIAINDRLRRAAAPR